MTFVMTDVLPTKSCSRSLVYLSIYLYSFRLSKMLIYGVQYYEEGIDRLFIFFTLGVIVVVYDDDDRNPPRPLQLPRIEQCKRFERSIIHPSNLFL
mmetsp:Transcript_42596/g.48411  ORF Transcript_42596/g.48411 Transcript_42596/m.48411 type:complete len:96 (-) Transcript_42596:78-365(-)